MHYLFFLKLNIYVYIYIYTLIYMFEVKKRACLALGSYLAFTAIDLFSSSWNGSNNTRNLPHGSVAKSSKIMD